MANPDDHIVSLEYIRLVASGAQGTVFEAKKIDSGELVAVKNVYLDPDPKKREVQTKALRAQFDIIKNLNHANVVRHMLTQTDLVRPNRPLAFQIIMEYCEGKTLHNLVREFPVPPLLLQKWTRQLVDGITYLHEQRCVHRDLKGANIVTTSNDLNSCHVKITDLGDIKRLMAEATRTGELSHAKGTFAFMSPEMINDRQIETEPAGEKAKLGRRTDIWSLGCVVIEMLNGTLPQFYRQGVLITVDLAVMHYVAKGGSPTIPAELPGKLSDFIVRCLKHHPNERPFGDVLKQHEFLTSPEEEIKNWILPKRLR
ncbi:uncharacterized protein LOC129585149 [Paramacrobiotus metropolitanus]|uniref:uncharacterized protein LOC129585149 n=1 Tax=Paramacrobiotus metropolitanus TaxID=2943436 RepID=UPI0024464709|nr:uncharacterized protein LOC129585149 [Paramacrobiotus metropolitanus]